MPTSKHGKLIFIDTNIYLDFYRMGQKSVRELNEIITRSVNSLISSFVVEMEFKNNRQSVIRHRLSEHTKVEEQVEKVPGDPWFVENSKNKSEIKELTKELREHVSTTSQKIKTLIRDGSKDLILECVNKVCSNGNPNFMRLDGEATQEVRSRARERFELGMPPRKGGDISFGDAFNWEWAMECAASQNADLLIVSRDADYGIQLDREYYLNDWLRDEFERRVKGRTVSLCGTLSHAFKELGVSASKELLSEENKLDQFIHNNRTEVAGSFQHLAPMGVFGQCGPIESYTTRYTFRQSGSSDD